MVTLCNLSPKQVTADCTICRSPIESQAAGHIDHGIVHAFCKEPCLRRWIQINPTCPNCNGAINNPEFLDQVPIPECLSWKEWIDEKIGKGIRGGVTMLMVLKSCITAGVSIYLSVSSYHLLTIKVIECARRCGLVPTPSWLINRVIERLIPVGGTIALGRILKTVVDVGHGFDGVFDRHFNFRNRIRNFIGNDNILFLNRFFSLGNGENFLGVNNDFLLIAVACPLAFFWISGVSMACPLIRIGGCQVASLAERGTVACTLMFAGSAMLIMDKMNWIVGADDMRSQLYAFLMFWVLISGISFSARFESSDFEVKSVLGDGITILRLKEASLLREYGHTFFNNLF